MDQPRNEMADSKGPDGEYLFPDLRKVTPAGDTIIDPDYGTTSVVGDEGSTADSPAVQPPALPVQPEAVEPEPLAPLAAEPSPTDESAPL